LDQSHRLTGVQPRASFGQRFLAYLLDVILLNVVGAAFIRGGGLRTIALGTVLTFVYFTLCEGSRAGQTLGKRIVGIRVVDFETGVPIDPTRAFVRTLGRWISGLVLLLGYLWMLWDPDHQTWHDKLSSTTVVPSSSFPLDRS
jgi:uncharacterized RDD family membrane protein YckC